MDMFTEAMVIGAMALVVGTAVTVVMYTVQVWMHRRAMRIAKGGRR